MPAVKRLKGGAPRLLGNHLGADGKAYRRCYDALDEEYGPLSPLGRLEAGRVAALYVQLQATTRTLAEAQRKRLTGRGRRPSAQAIERLSRRQGLVDGSYSQALEKLRALAAGRNGHQALASALAELHGPPGARR
jgi:hypothetical protein